MKIKQAGKIEEPDIKKEPKLSSGYTKIFYYSAAGLFAAAIVILLYFFVIKKNNNSQDNFSSQNSTADSLKRKELDLREQELKLKEESINKKDSSLRVDIKPPVISAYFISDNKQESANLVDNKDFELFNVIIGDGMYKGRNLPKGSSVRVKIVFFGNAELNYDITVKEKTEMSGGSKFKIRKKISDKTNMNVNNSNIIEFIVKDIGCMPLIISAEASSGIVRKETVKTINFYCGE